MLQTMSYHSHKLLHLLTQLRKVRAKYYPKRGVPPSSKSKRSRRQPMWVSRQLVEPNYLATHDASTSILPKQYQRDTVAASFTNRSRSTTHRHSATRNLEGT